MMRWWLLGMLTLSWPVAAHGWWIKAHAAITEAAALRLHQDVPPFFRANGKQLGYLSGEPDRWKNPDARFLRAGESPEHYVDLEDYKGEDFPADRYKAIALLMRLNQRPERTGMLPYALMEYYERLSIAFSDYRTLVEREKQLGSAATPAERQRLALEKQAIEMKCLTYGGILAHYTGDACMPLHTTIDFDGRTKEKSPDGKKLQQGIHEKIDAFPVRHGLSPEEMSRPLEARAIDDVWKHVVATIKESHTHVDRCYALDKVGGFDNPTPESRQFILERCQVAAQFTADLWYGAWVRSAKLSPSTNP